MDIGIVTFDIISVPFFLDDGHHVLHEHNPLAIPFDLSSNQLDKFGRSLARKTGQIMTQITGPILHNDLGKRPDGQG